MQNFERLMKRYLEPWRKYHNFDHINEMLQYLTAFYEEDIPNYVFWAVMYHDAIYKPGAVDNEAASGDLLREELDKVLTSDEIIKAQAIIRCTGYPHKIPDEVEQPFRGDVMCVVDTDLAGFSQPWIQYVETQLKVQEELAPASTWSWEGSDSDDVKRESLDLWMENRLMFLREYLKRRPFYYTDLFDENLARANIRREIWCLEHRVALQDEYEFLSRKR